MSIHKNAQLKRTNPHNISSDILYRWSPKTMAGEAIDFNDLKALLEAARWAPSSRNSQEWHYYYAPRETSAFQDLFNLLTPDNQKWCGQAAVLLILVSNKFSDYKHKKLPSHSFDTGASSICLQIEACRRNLVAHPMLGFDKEAAQKYLNLGKEFSIEIMMAIGKPTPEIEQEKVSLRRPLTEISTNLSQKNTQH